MFLFFFMEETNYYREPSLNKVDTIDISARSPSKSPEINGKPVEGNERKIGTDDVTVIDAECNLPERYSKKSYLNKLKIFETRRSQYPNRLKGMILRPLVFLRFPVILYAGFSYGSNLIWFNVLNGTASLILSKKPYKFSSSSIGLAYLSPFIGITAA